MSAVLEKLGKALDSLKISKFRNSEDASRKKKETIKICLSITDLVCSSNMKNSKNLPSILNVTTLALLDLLEDADSNTRLMIDESLNKIFKAVTGNHNLVAKLLVALLSIMKKSDNARSLKVAVSKFAELAHYIRPQKGKLYVSTVIPILVKLAECDDDVILETLASSLTKIMRNIGCYTNDSDIKVLLRTFMKNLASDSAEGKRAAATSIVSVCQYSRRPEYFLTNVFSHLVELLAKQYHRNTYNSTDVVGYLICVRQILPYLTNIFHDQHLKNKNIERDYFFQLYELLLSFLFVSNHNVITCSLETLNEFLKSTPLEIMECLATVGGYSNSVIDRNIHSSVSTLSLSSDCDERNIDNNSDMGDVFSDVCSGSVNSVYFNKDDAQSISSKMGNERTDSMSDSSSMLNIKMFHFANSDEEEDRSETNTITEHTRSLSLNNLQRSDSEMDDISEIPEQSLASSFISIDPIYPELDVGTCVDEDESSLNYCSRILVSLFLINDTKKIRVSVISLALTCLSNIFEISSNCALITIQKNVATYNGMDCLLECVLQYGSHDDQQLRGISKIVIGQFIKSFMKRCNVMELNEKCEMEKLIQIMEQGILDESSICIRHSLTAVATCLSSLIGGKYHTEIVKLLQSLFQLTSYSYWLVKVAMLELISIIPFRDLYYDNERMFQKKILDRIIMAMLADEDNRVRVAAANSLSLFIHNAYYETDSDSVAVTEIIYQNALIYSTEIYNNIKQYKNICIDASLSRVVYDLTCTLMDDCCKHTLSGSYGALALLSDNFSPSMYPSAWGCSKSHDTNLRTCDLFEIGVDLLTTTPVLLELDNHINILQFTSNLFSGIFRSSMVEKRMPFSEDGLWSIVAKDEEANFYERYFQHVFQLMNILAHVVGENSTASWPTVAILSPVLKSTTLPQSPFSPSSWKNIEHAIKSGKIIERKRVAFGYYSDIPSYVKLKDTIQSSYNNYKVTLEKEYSEKFTSFLKTVITCLCKILEYSTLNETDRICEELLACLRLFYPLEPVHSIRCVTQLLKSVFGTNAIGEYLDKRSLMHSESREPITEDYYNGFYNNCFRIPSHTVKRIMESRSNTVKENNALYDWDTKEREGKSSAFGYAKHAPSMDMLPSYIKLFEHMVIQSMKVYANTSDTTLQAEVLSLLTQLIQVRVNYCLLDPELIFIKSLLSQFQLIEEGHVQNIENLIPNMFNFLVNLSYEKQNSKPVMTIPKVIQLCDTLIASEQSTINCITAIEPIIDYIFLKTCYIASSGELEQIETQRDVLFTILLRLIYHTKGMKLLSTVMTEGTDEKRYQRSCNIFEVLSEFLCQCKLQMDSHDSIQSLLKLMLQLHPNSYNAQSLLKILLNLYSIKKEQIVDKERWLKNIIVIIMFIFMKFDQVQLLSAMSQCEIPSSLSNNDVTDDGNVSDPLGILPKAQFEFNPSSVFARLLYGVILTVVENITVSRKLSILIKSHDQMENLFIWFLNLVEYVTKCESYNEIKAALVKVMDEEIYKKIDSYFDNLVEITPFVTIRWFSLVMNVTNEQKGFVTSFLKSKRKRITGYNGRRLNMHIINCGLFLSACDNMEEDMKCNELFQEFLDIAIEDIINNYHEDSIQKLLNFMQNSPSISGIFIQVLKRKLMSQLVEENLFAHKTLQCLEYVHDDLTGEVLLICSKKLFIDNKLVSETAGALAVRCAEYLLTIRGKEEFENQLSKDSLEMLLTFLAEENVHPRILLMLLNKLAFQWFKLPAVESPNFKQLRTNHIQKQAIDPQWLLNRIQNKSCEKITPKVTAEMLRNLSLVEIRSIMRLESFNQNVVQYCFRISANDIKMTFKNDGKVDLNDLYIASKDIINEEISNILRRFDYEDEMNYNLPHINDILNLIPTLNEYLTTVDELLHFYELEQILPSHENVIKFFLLALKVIRKLEKLDEKLFVKSTLLSCLQCGITICKIKTIFDKLTAKEIHIILSALHIFVEDEFRCSIQLVKIPLFEDVTEIEKLNVVRCCRLVCSLIDHFVAERKYRNTVSYTMRRLLSTISQSPVLYNFIHVPNEAWKYLTLDDVIIDNQINVNNIPNHLLQDPEILQEFVKRTVFAGWRNRQQFEELWVTYLSVLSTEPTADTPRQELTIIFQANSIAVSAMTSLLVQTLLLPIPGNTGSSSILHVSRNKCPHDVNVSWRSSLSSAMEILKSKFSNDLLCLHDNLYVNLERIHSSNRYGYNQISVKYLYLRCTDQWETEDEIDDSKRLRKIITERDELMTAYGIDMKSSTYFLIEYYTQLFQRKESNEQQRVLLEVMKSIVIISDFFWEISQYHWMLDTCIALHEIHSTEDEVIYQYLVLATCKAASFLDNFDNDTSNKVINILISGLESAFYPTKISSLHGLLYLLETIFYKNQLYFENASVYEFNCQIISIASHYVVNNIDDQLPDKSSEHGALCVISIAYYLLNNDACKYKQREIVQALLKLTLSLWKSKRYSLFVVSMQAIYNMIYSGVNVITNNDVTSLVKGCFSDQHPCDAIFAVINIQLLTAVMYSSGKCENSNINEMEYLSSKLENISILFERMRNGLKEEVEVISVVLPNLLDYMFPASEILNKLINEFLSSRQPHPELIANVLFHVFRHAIENSQLSILQQWVLSLLHNFSHGYLLPIAAFRLTCLLISASTNESLTSVFPDVVSRIGLWEFEDQRLLCLSAIEFYAQLKVEDKEKFVELFEKVVKLQPEHLFAHILFVIKDHDGISVPKLA